MASNKPSRRFVVDLKAREKAYGQIYVWLYRRHGKMVALLEAATPHIWEVTASLMAGDGVRSIAGSAPTRNAVQLAWLKVAKHKGADALRLASARESNTGHVSRRHKGWVPTSSPPPKAPASQVSTQQISTPGPPPPPQASPHPTPVPPDPASPIEPVQEAPLGHPDHPLGALTALELAKLADYLDCSVEIQRRVLKSYRQVRHMDRFSRPGWQ